MSVCRCVCVSVRFHVLDFEAYFAPTSQSWMSKFFRDLCWKEVVSELNIFVGKWSKIAADFALQNMVETTLPDELETSGRNVYR